MEGVLEGLSLFDEVLRELHLVVQEPRFDFHVHCRDGVDEVLSFVTFVHEVVY